MPPSSFQRGRFQNGFWFGVIPAAVLLASGLATARAAGLDGFINHGLVGVGRVPADTFDALGEKQDTLGGIFSSMAFVAGSWRQTGGGTNGYTYSGNLYALPDRGFGDGSQNYHPRIQTLALTITPYYGTEPVGQSQIRFTNTATLLLRHGGTNLFTGMDAGDASAISFPRSAPTGLGQGARSLDPEGLVLAPDGGFWVSDEYGPFIYRFDEGGELKHMLQPPASILPKVGEYPGTNHFSAAGNPHSGRQPNRGFEGLSLTPDGTRLFAILQSPLAQDGGAQLDCRNTRLVAFDVRAGSPDFGKVVGEYVYQLTLHGSSPDHRHTPVNEIVALDAERFLVLERDGLGLGGPPLAPLYKRVNVASIHDASNLAGTAYDLEAGAPHQLSLPHGSLPPEVMPMERLDFVDLLDPAQLARFGLNTSTNQDGNTLSEKWEGLGLVPLHDDGAPNDYLLLVGNDNDFRAKLVYHNGVIVGTNQVPVDTMLLAYRVTLPGVGTPRPTNQAPRIAITGPTNATFSVPAEMKLTASASDHDGLVARVEFFIDGQPVAETTGLPYQTTVTRTNAGQYIVTARATDNEGATTMSAPRTLVVTTENLPPQVALTGPTNATLSTPASFSIQAHAVDPDGKVVGLEFFQDGGRVEVDRGGKHKLHLAGVNAGVHSYVAEAIDNRGARATSEALRVRVTLENLLPTIALHSPTNGLKLPAGHKLLLSAEAADPDGSVARVEFYRGDVKLGEAAHGPFTLSSTNFPNGDWECFAIAVDNHGATNRSASATIHVEASTK